MNPGALWPRSQVQAFWSSLVLDWESYKVDVLDVIVSMREPVLRA